jgi:hypothetical protein
MSYKAFCNNFGEHQTTTAGYHCWNEEAMRGMTEDVAEVWEVFIGNLNTHLEQNQIFVNEAFNIAIQVVQTAGTYELRVVLRFISLS